MDFDICIFGDSITWGGFDSERGGWAERMKTALFSYKGKWITVYNLGISGKDSNNLTERYLSELRSRDGNIAIIAIGINDSCYIGDEFNNLVPIELFKKNLNTIKRISEEIGLYKLIFIGLTRVNESLTCPYPGSSTGKSYKNNIIEKYDNSIREFCEIEIIPYIDMRNVLSLADLPDGLHPDTIGNQKMLEKILPELKKILDI